MQGKKDQKKEEKKYNMPEMNCQHKIELLYGLCLEIFEAWLWQKFWLKSFS